MAAEGHCIPQDLSHQHAAWRVPFPVPQWMDCRAPLLWPSPDGLYPPLLSLQAASILSPPNSSGQTGPCGSPAPGSPPQWPGHVSEIEPPWSWLFLPLPISMAPSRGRKTGCSCPENSLLPAAFAGFHTHLTPVRHSAARTCPARGASPARSRQLLGIEKEDGVRRHAGSLRETLQIPTFRLL